MSNLKVLLLNGPPRAGKDTAADLITKRWTAQMPCNRPMTMKMAEPLRRAVCGLLSIPDADIEKLKDGNWLGADRGVRRLMIGISEDVMKPLFGQRVFGQLLAERIAYFNELEHSDRFIISDSGFLIEAEPLVDAFGPENVSVVQIHRPEHSFDGDSREWVDLLHRGVSLTKVTNSGSIEEFDQSLWTAVGRPFLEG